MKKTIKRYGNSNVIILNKDDMKIYDVKTGDVIELHILKINGKEYETNNDY